ncbi:MAG TPA: phosphorylase [Pseudolabrys sp.]|nr:phosphorylase [Pseudolabrys sp.]
MIVVVGLAFEARIAARTGSKVVCGGAGRDLAAEIHNAIDADCHGLLSFGVAGGLHPDLAPGTCIVASAIVDGDQTFATDEDWSQRLLRTLPHSKAGVLAGTAGPVATSSTKSALHRSTGAVAVDMESHVVARVAADRRLPMTALRVVCDPAARGLPDMALQSVRPDGTTDVFGLLRSLARRPHHVPALIRVALDARAARATLLQCGEALAPHVSLAQAGVAARPAGLRAAG